MVIASHTPPAVQRRQSVEKPTAPANPESPPHDNLPLIIGSSVLLPSSVVIAATALFGMDKAVPAMVATTAVASLATGVSSYGKGRQLGESAMKAGLGAAFCASLAGVCAFCLSAVAAPENGGFPMLPFRPDQLGTLGTVAAVAAPILLAAGALLPGRGRQTDSHSAGPSELAQRTGPSLA